MVQTLTPQKIKTVGIIGAGQMGSGIAQVMAHYGQYQVVVHDVAQHQLEKAQQGIESSLSKFVSKEVLTEAEKSEALKRLQFKTGLDALKDADIVVEAILEDESLKQAIFRELDRLLKPEAILASNTSSISITRLAACTQRPDRVIGMHFMNPVPLMKLV